MKIYYDMEKSVESWKTENKLCLEKNMSIH